MRPLAALGCALALFGCAGYGTPPQPASQAVDDHIGQKRWFVAKFPTTVCETPRLGDLASKCTHERSGPFIIEAVQNDPRHVFTSYQIRYGRDRLGWISSLDLITTDDEAGHRETLASKAECDRRGGIAVGMSRSQVYASCWGKPSKINSTTVAGGTHEQLVYPGFNYIYLTNGVVSGIQTSR